MRNSKPQPRNFTDPKHLIWIRYFEKTSKIPKLPRGVDAELNSIFQQILHPTTLKKQIFAQPTQMNLNNDEFLLDLFELRSPISQGEINLVKYVKNHPELLSKPFKILKIIGNSLVRTIIRFFTLIWSSLLEDESDAFSLSIFREDALNITWLTFHLPSPYKKDVRFLCENFLNLLPFPKETKNLIFESVYFRAFECSIFEELVNMIKYQKVAKSFYVSAFSFLVRYAGTIADAVGSKLLEKDEIKNVSFLGNSISRASSQFIMSIPADVKVLFIEKMLRMINDYQHVKKSFADDESTYKMGIATFAAIKKLLFTDKSLVDVVINDANYQGIIMFPVWCMDTFQNPDQLVPLSPVFEEEKAVEQKYLDYEFYSSDASQEQPQVLKDVKLNVLTETDYKCLDPHSIKSIESMMTILMLLPNTNIIDMLFSSCFLNLNKIMQGNKDIYDGMKSGGRFALIYTWFIASFIVLHPISWADQKEDVITENCFLLLSSKYIFDFCSDILPEEHIPRSFARRELFNALKAIYNSSGDKAREISSFIASLAVGSHLHVCDELLMFIYTLFNENQETFVSLFGTDTLVSNAVCYGISLQKTTYTNQKKMCWSYFTKFMQNEELCRLFYKSKPFVEFNFHFLFDKEYYTFFAQFLSENLLKINEEECIEVFCSVFHDFLVHVSDNLNDKYDMLIDLFGKLYKVFCAKKELLREPVKENKILTDCVEIVKKTKGSKAQKLVFSIFKDISIIIKDDDEFKVQLDRYHDDLYDQKLEAFTGEKCIPEVLETLWFFVFEKPLMSTGSAETYFIKNPESLNLLHNITYNKPSHEGLLSFVYEVAKSTFTNNYAISTSNFIETLINFLRESVDSAPVSFKVIENIFELQFSWNFQSRYFLQLIGPHKSEKWLDVVLNLLPSFIKPQDPDEITSFILLSGLNTIIKLPKVKLSPESKGLTIAFTFRVDRILSKFTLCSFVSDMGDLISIYVNKGTLMYMSPNNVSINTGKQIDVGVWNNIAITVNGFNFIIFINGVQVVSHWEAFKFGKEPFVNASIGALFNLTAPAQISVASIHVFSDPLTTEDHLAITSKSAKEMLSYNSKDLVIYNTADKSTDDKMLNQVSNREKSTRFHGTVITKTTIHTAVLRTNGILRLLQQVKKSEQLNRILDILCNLIKGNKRFEEQIVDVFSFSNLSAKLLSYPPSIINTDTAKYLSKIFNELTNEANKKRFIRDVWFSLYFWIRLDVDVFVDAFNKYHLPVIKTYPKFVHSLIAAQQFLNIIPCIDDSTKREKLWELLLSYFAIRMNSSDQSVVIEFVYHAPEPFALELLLHFFGFINLSEQTSNIMWELTSENMVILIFRFILLLSSERTKNLAATYITEESWLKVKNEFMTLKSNPLMFIICIITSQFHDQSFLINFIKEIVILAGNNPLVITNIVLNPLPEIWGFFIISKCSKRIIDFDEKGVITEFFTKVAHISFTLDNKFEYFLVSIFAFGTVRKVDVTPLIRNIFIGLLKGIHKKDKVDWKRIIKIIFKYLFMIPKSDQFSMNTELLKAYGIQKQNIIQPRTPNDLTIIDIISLFLENDNEKVVPLSLNIRADAKQNFPDLDLAILLIQSLKNIPHEILDEKVFESLNVGQLIVYTLIMITSADPNTSGDMMILFEKIFPPETCKWTIFAPFAYSMYNSIASLTYWRSTFGRFCQKYAKNFGPYQTMVCGQEENIIYTNRELNHYALQQFGETSMYFTELLIRYTKHVESLAVSYRNSTIETLSSLKKEAEKQRDSSSIYAEALIGMSAHQVSVSECMQCISNINAFDNCNLPCKYDRYDPPDIDPITPLIKYDNSFHPIATTFIEKKFTDLSFYIFGSRFPDKSYFINEEKKTVVSICEITSSDTTCKTLFYLCSDSCIVGGFSIKLKNMKYIIKRGQKSIELFATFGSMILVKFPDLTTDELVAINPEIFAVPPISSPISVFDHILRQNFFNGKSFNDPDNLPIFPVVNENGITEGFWQAEDYTLDLYGEKFNRITYLESSDTHRSVHEWITENLGADADMSVSYTDPSKQGLILVNSYTIAGDPSKQKSNIIYSDVSNIVTEAGSFATFSPYSVMHINVGTNSKCIILNDTLLYTSNVRKGISTISIEANHEENVSEDASDGAFIKCGEIVEFVPYLSNTCFARVRPVNQFSRFSNESLIQIFNNTSIFYILSLSTRKIVSADSSKQLGVVAALDERGRVYVSDILRRADEISFLTEGGSKILLFNSGCIVTLNGRKLTSYSISGHVNCTSMMDADITCISKIEFDGFSEFVFCGLDNGSSLFLDAHSLHTAKVINTKGNITSAYFNKRKKKLTFVISKREILFTNFK